ncbi:MAG: hypothetical protein V3S25_11525 [Nitrospirales bacterium]
MFEQIEWISGVALIGLGVLLIYASNLIRGQRVRIDDLERSVADLLEDADEDSATIFDLREELEEAENAEIELDIDLDGEDDDDDLD